MEKSVTSVSIKMSGDCTKHPATTHPKIVLVTLVRVSSSFLRLL